MSRYRKIEVRTWSDEKFRALSAIPPSGQGLWFFLLTGPHTTAIPGLFRAGRAAMAEELGWEIEAFDEAFTEVFTQGMAKADFKARLVWLPKALQHNKPESPNVVRSWRAELDLLPECDLKREAIASIRESLADIGNGYLQAFDELFSPVKVGSPEGGSKASGKPSGKPSAKTTPNQEQEQEQDIVGAAFADTPPANPAEPEEPAEQPKARIGRGTRLPNDWSLPKAWGDWALTEFPAWTPEVVRLEADKFADHWRAKAGKDASKTDWQATWRNWCRSDIAQRARPSAQATHVGDWRSNPAFAGVI